MSDEVRLAVPATAEFLRLARVTAAGLASRLGFTFDVVPEQDQFDGRFPTVQSPNPENAEALKLAIELAKQRNADLVIATDPDCDRMGAAVRSGDGAMKLLTGNQIGSLLAYYRAKKLFEQGVLTPENASRGVIIKDFDRGLVDFPHWREGREVLLCWELSEDRVRFWHDLETGYAGREPI